MKPKYKVLHLPSSARSSPYLSLPNRLEVLRYSGLEKVVVLGGTCRPF